jgi:hypothetical protein
MRVSRRDPVGGGSIPVRTNYANEALALMERALSLIDANNGPHDAGAHLDLAIHRLKEWIASSPD